VTFLTGRLNKREIILAVMVGVVTFVAQVAADFNPDQVADWQTWAVATAGGAARAAGVATLAALGVGTAK
jgi:hypothetical protein